MKIGFTVGVYDLLHSGHVKLFERAKELCDVLIVGVVGDEAVYEQKGAGRPVQSQEERMYLVSSLKPVNEVIALKGFNPMIELCDKFGDNTEKSVFSTLTMFIKGEDQDHINHSYADIHGIPLVYFKRTPHVSTSATIERLNATK